MTEDNACDIYVKTPTRGMGWTRNRTREMEGRLHERKGAYEIGGEG